MKNLPANWAAVLRLQNKFDRAQPLTFEESVYDHAIELALGRLGADPSFLAHNCYRHAKTTIARRLKSFKNTITAVSGDEIFQLTDYSVNLEENVSSEEAIRYLYRLAQNWSVSMLQCITHWVEGLSIEESATEMGKTPFAVNKMRQRFKAKARPHFEGGQEW